MPLCSVITIALQNHNSKPILDTYSVTYLSSSVLTLKLLGLPKITAVTPNSN